MKVALEIILDALKDSLIILPFLFLIYVLIEVIEMYSVTNLKAKHILQGKFSPLIASSLGLVPQCGFSVVATDLYSKKYITLGTLLSVFIATSDEAIPIMLSNFRSAKMLLPMLLIKFVVAMLIGYGAYLIQSLVDKRHSEVGVIGNASNTKTTTKDIKANGTHEIKMSVKAGDKEDSKHEHNSEHEHTNEHNHNAHNHNTHEHNHDEHNHDHEHKEDEEDKIESIGCCGHHLEEQPTKLDRFLWHPLIHSLKIFAFILIVNLVLGTVLHFVGEDKLAVALGVNTYWQPLVAGLIGLIPNCASSVAITQLYVANSLSFGACMAGLTANAGVAYVVLFKHNKNLKNNLLIIGGMYVISVIVGFITMLIF